MTPSLLLMAQSGNLGITCLPGSKPSDRLVILCHSPFMSTALSALFTPLWLNVEITLIVS